MTAVNCRRFKCRRLSSIPFASLLVATLRRIAASIVGSCRRQLQQPPHAPSGAENHTKQAPLFPFGRNAGILTSSLLGRPLHNKPIDTDPQQQEAASPLVLVVRSSSR